MVGWYWARVAPLQLLPSLQLRCQEGVHAMLVTEYFPWIAILNSEKTIEAFHREKGVLEKIESLFGLLKKSIHQGHSPFGCPFGWLSAFPSIQPRRAPLRKDVYVGGFKSNKACFALRTALSLSGPGSMELAPIG